MAKTSTKTTKVALTRTYRYQGQSYGPGESVAVPEGLAAALRLRGDELPAAGTPLDVGASEDSETSEVRASKTPSPAEQAATATLHGAPVRRAPAAPAAAARKK